MAGAASRSSSPTGSAISSGLLQAPDRPLPGVTSRRALWLRLNRHKPHGCARPAWPGTWRHRPGKNCLPVHVLRSVPERQRNCLLDPGNSVGHTIKGSTFFMLRHRHADLFVYGDFKRHQRCPVQFTMTGEPDVASRAVQRRSSSSNTVRAPSEHCPGSRHILFSMSPPTIHSCPHSDRPAFGGRRGILVIRRLNGDAPKCP